MPFPGARSERCERSEREGGVIGTILDLGSLHTLGVLAPWESEFDTSAVRGGAKAGAECLSQCLLQCLSQRLSQPEE